jgi:hypothetical protein
MCRKCVYQKLSDDLEWVCPGEAICDKRCEEGLIPVTNQPQPVRGKSYGYVDRCDGLGWVRLEKEGL